jgi:hypothetical protein
LLSLDFVSAQQDSQHTTVLCFLQAFGSQRCLLASGLRLRRISPKADFPVALCVVVFVFLHARQDCRRHFFVSILGWRQVSRPDFRFCTPSGSCSRFSSAG